MWIGDTYIALRFVEGVSPRHRPDGSTGSYIHMRSGITINCMWTPEETVERLFPGEAHVDMGPL